MPNPMARITSMRRQDENSYAFATSYHMGNCSILRFVPAIGRMDTLGNIMDYKYYDFGEGCRFGTGDLIVTSDTSIITWGSDTSFFAIKVNSDLEGIWGKRFNRHGGFQFIKELPGGDLLAGINMDTAGAVVARLDAGGNFIWCKSYIRPKGMVNDAIIESDDSFIITGFTDSINTSIFEPLPSTFQPKLFMMKLNGDGEVDWCRGYDSSPNDWYTPQMFRTIKTTDGNYMVLATLGYPGYNFFFRPLLMKTDQNGDTLWTRSVGRSQYDLFAMNLLECSDKGLLLSGYMWGNLPGGNSSAAYLFKADSLGHFPCWERTYTVQISDLFPTDSSFTLTSTDGLVAHPAIANDTIFPFSAYDGCTFTTGIPDQSRSRPKPTVRPNPTPGRFTVEFQDPLVKDTYYSVYDTMGKLLFQRAAAHGKKTEEVDLTGYSKGTYVIRFTDPEGACYERVVVE